MAFSTDLLFTLDFSDTNTVQVDHGKNRRVFVQVIVNSEVADEMVQTIILDKADPLNILTVLLTQACSGRIQIFSAPGIYAGELSPEESAAVSVASIDPGDPPVKRSELDTATSNKSWTDPVDAVQGGNPLSPTIGYRVLVHGGASGEFSGHEGEIAEYTGTSWTFHGPTDGLTTTNKDDGIQWIQYASEAPWAWRSDTGGTSIHGNEKHSPNLLTVGGNRSDSAIDLLTCGNIADKLHRHQEISRNRALFMDDFLGYRYNKYTWYLKRSGSSSFDIHEDLPGGQSRIKTSNRGSVYLSWKSRTGLASGDAYFETRIRKQSKSSYFEAGIENLDGKQAMISSDVGDNWTCMAPSYTHDSGIPWLDEFITIGIRVSGGLIVFEIDKESVGECDTFDGAYMPFIYQEGYDRNQYTFMDYIYCESGRI